MSITPLDSIRRAIARRNGVTDPTVSSGAHGQGGRIENGLFPASHTAEELARIQELSQRNAGGPDSGQATRRRRERDREPGPIHRMVNAWWNRLLGAVYGGGFSTQEAEYEEHATSRDYLWNTLGTAVWGMAFPLLTIVSTQLVGAEEAGKFSIAFVTGTLIMIACNYGVRNFQVSDIDEKTSFASYQLNRWLCGAIALACGLAYSSARGYDAHMATIGLGVYLYKVVDGVADVYEGRLQQADKLYLAGMSQTLRSVGVIAVFSVALFLTRSMPIAAMATGVTAIASLMLVTAPLALLETEKSRHVSLREVGHLFVQCAPLFGALFLFNLIESMPKFVMEGTLAYKYQLYFNALFFPAQAILLSIGFVYKPQLLRLSSIWANPRKRRRFDLIIIAVMALIVAITGVCAIARKKGTPVNIVKEAGQTPASEMMEKLSQLPEYQGVFLSVQDAILAADVNALLVVVDTNRPEQVVSQDLLESSSKVAVIDHHRRAATYIANAALNFHEPYASSASELVTELLQYLLESADLRKAEAEALLAGITLDTKQFTMRTGSRTFEAAAFLRRSGADTGDVKKLFQNDLEGTIARYDIIQNARMYRNDIAVARVDHPVGRITAAQAADELLNISGIDTSFVLFPDGEGRVILSARSMGDVNVQVILEKLGGGGNAATAGAQVPGKSVEEVTKDLLRAIDQYLEEE